MLKINIEVYDTYNPYTIGVKDTSNYSGFPIISPTLIVTPPNFPQKEIPFTINSHTEYTREDLIGSICGSKLPDGNYVFEYSIKPHEERKVKKNFFRVTCALFRYFELLNRYLESCDCNANKKELNNLMEIRMLLEGATASANLGDVCGAEIKYDLAINKIKRHEKQKDCEC